MKDKPFTITQFFKRFPDDDSCLEHLMAVRHGDRFECPKCSKEGNWSRVRKIPAYACSWCGHHVHPMAGTPFARSHTPLQKWFYAMYLFTTSRHGVPAKELQRQLGVTYKTAWRMGHEIRKYMGVVDGDDGMSGHVEADEAYIGPPVKRKRGGKMGKGRYLKNKSTVFGIVERDGHIYTEVVPNAQQSTLLPILKRRVPEGTTVSTDTASQYRSIGRHGFKHGAVNHNVDEWVRGIHHTNTLEGFWARLKNSIKGTHVHVSRKHLPKYLAEFEYRFNMRSNPSAMFDDLLVSF